MKTLEEHSTAATAAVLTGLSALIVWLLGLWGIVDVPPAVAAALAGLIVSLGLGIKSRGIRGLVSVLWSGNHVEPEPPPPPPPSPKRTFRKR